MRITRAQGAPKHRAARRAAETRLLYSFEVARLRDRELLKIRSIGALRRFAARVWELEKPKRPGPTPEIMAGTGTKQSGRYLSYCQGHRIVLARHERNRLVLLHELIHAVGFTTHGVGFRKRYFKVLHRFGGRMNAATRRSLAVSLKSLR